MNECDELREGERERGGERRQVAGNAGRQERKTDGNSEDILYHIIS
jgi:hypothetical protein